MLGGGGVSLAIRFWPGVREVAPLNDRGMVSWVMSFHGPRRTGEGPDSRPHRFFGVACAFLSRGRGGGGGGAELFWWNVWVVPR